VRKIEVAEVASGQSRRESRYALHTTGAAAFSTFAVVIG